jgi:hypothetical protein
MNVYKPFTAVSEQFTFPSAIDVGTAKVTVFYEWGDTIVAQEAATLVSGQTFKVDIDPILIDSVGTWRVKWEAKFSGTNKYFYTNFSVEQPYIDYDTFVTNHPEYNDSELTPSDFDVAERLSRRIIDTYCGQEFGWIQNKTITMDGNGRSTLFLPARLNFINTATIDGSDYVDSIALARDTHRHITISTPDDVIKQGFPTQTFPDGAPIVITGDWGWVNVPWQIEQATELLVIDILESVRREHKTYGILRIWQDTNRLEFTDKLITGNSDVDVLLMDYVYWTLDYVI